MDCWTVRPTCEGWQVQTCQDVPRHDITSHDLTWHSGTTLLPSSILCYQVFPQILLRASIQLVMTLLEAVSVSKELLSLKTHSFHSELLPRSFWTLLPLFWSQYPNLPQPTGYQEAGDWTSEATDSQKTSKNDGRPINNTMMSHEISHLQRKLLSRCWTEASWGNLHLVASVPGLAPTLWRCFFLGRQPKCAEDL